jgi:NAD(P)-dependent dehydrogenase (short-subunit alcohol dehydrogenase family)
MARLDGKVAIVTGAASRAEGVGNGAAVAILMAREGARVVLANRSRDRAEALAAQIRDEGGTALAVAADVADEADAARLAATTLEHFGRIDILHNNVGIGGTGTPETITLETWDRVFRTNLTSALLCCRAVLPAMRAQGGGSIINVSSIAGMTGLSGSPGAVAYTTTKAGLQGFTLSVAADYAVHGVRCNCIVVGTVNTPMVAHLGEEARERRRRGVPLQSEGTGWDVGHAAVYLASDEARWVTGVMLPIDGGFLAIRAWPR